MESQDGQFTDPRGVQSTIISKGAVTLDPPEFGTEMRGHLPREVYRNMNVLQFDEENSFESSSRQEVRVIESPIERLDVMES